MPAKRAPPTTGAERQRAYRARQAKGQIALPNIELPADDEPSTALPALPDEVSLPELNARIRRMALQAFDEVGGVLYLRKVAAKNANTFLRFVGQFVTKEDTINPGAYNIYVQQLTVENVQPVPGVLCSPVAGHIDVNARLPLSPSDTIEEDVTDA